MLRVNDALAAAGGKTAELFKAPAQIHRTEGSTRRAEGIRQGPERRRNRGARALPLTPRPARLPRELSMPLVKSPVMTARKIAANRRNRRLSRGPATPQGKARIAAAQLRHGFYAKAQNSAFRCLGENPSRFQELLSDLYQEFPPTGRLGEELVNRLARVLWLMDRADRSQEGHALRRFRVIDSGRENRLHARMMRLKMTANSLQLLAHSVQREHYVTAPRDIDLMKGLEAEPELGEMGGIAVALFTQLADPGAVDEFGRPTATRAQQEQVLLRIKEIFGLAGPYAPVPQPADAAISTRQGAVELEGTAPAESADAVPPPPVKPQPEPYPHITAEEWEAREPVRQLLENILVHQSELCEAIRQACLKEAVSGPSPYERAAEIAPTPAEALVARRVQDANMREVRRITNLLLKMQRLEAEIDGAEAGDEAAICHEVEENKKA